VSDLVSLLIDEDVSSLVAILLRSRGLEITTVREESRLGKTDIEQLEWAATSNRCFLTHNRVDFERLHLRYIEQEQKHAGIIVVPQKNPYEVAQRVGILVTTLPAAQIQNQLLYA
jgi:predicted nuclease of predicted toxin-antitoxin system